MDHADSLSMSGGCVPKLLIYDEPFLIEKEVVT
jgi:hypothetical protein